MPEIRTQRLAEMRAMAKEAQRNNGHGKHDDPAYYSRNLAALLLIAVDDCERYREALGRVTTYAAPSSAECGYAEEALANG